MKGKWISPGGHARKFVCSGIDLSLTWYFGKYNSLILHGELSSDLSDALIKVCQQTATFKTNTRCDDKLTTSPLAGELFSTAPNTNDDSYYLSAISTDNEATIKPEVLFKGDTTLDEHCYKVRSKRVCQKSSGISQCDCKCGLLAAELEGIKLDMVIMQRNFESKIPTSNTIRESDEIKCLKQELANAKERCKHLEGEIQTLIKGRNNEVEDLNQTIVSLETTLALVYLVHNWYQNMDSTGKVVRVSLLDFRKDLIKDLINHNILLENFMDIGVRPSLIRWFATYLQGRRQMCTFRNQKSECKGLKGGIPQGSILRPLAFIIKINQLANVVKTPSDDHNAGSSQEDIVIFMDDTTLSEVIDVTNHVSGNSIGNSQSTVNDITRFTEKEQMELNAKKCNEVIVDFRKNKTVIPPVCIGQRPMSRVKTFKLLGLWMNDNLNWETNTEYIIKKATKRLYFLKVLKSYGAPKNDLKIFYCCVIRSTLEYAAQVWYGNLTQAQRIDIERVQKRALRIIVPEYEYNRALQECALKTLQQRRDDLCVRLIKQMSEPSHKLHSLLPRKCSEVKERETRTNSGKFYNFFCRTQRFKRSPIVYAIDKYNDRLNV